MLQVLWSGSGPMTAADVRMSMTGDLAYTSVATVLSRLFAKGLVTRNPVGRTFRYEPVITREDWYASKMTAVLKEAPNHRLILAGFVGKLSKRDLNELRRLLADGAD